METMLTVRQVGRALALDVKRVRALIRTGQLVASNVGTVCKPLYRVEAEQLRAFIEATRVVGIEEG